MQRTPSYSQANDKVTEMNSLSMVMAKAVKNGYIESFKVTRTGLTPASNMEHSYSPEEVQVINFYRFEGESDPGDNSIMYQIETSDGLKRHPRRRLWGICRRKDERLYAAGRGYSEEGGEA